MVNFFQKLGLGLKKTSAKLTGGISDIFTKQKVDSQTLNDLQDVLIAADMGVKASAKIIETFGKRRLNKDISEAEIRSELAADIEQILTPCEKGFVIDNHKKPCIILMIGGNGAGKTTTIGKLAAKLKNAQSGHKPQISFIAGDTFRAAAVEQLSVWGERNGIRVFKGSDGCDAAGLCYDGIQEALRQNDDIVFIDTAGMRPRSRRNTSVEVFSAMRSEKASAGRTSACWSLTLRQASRSRTAVSPASLRRKGNPASSS